jgi:hypothetical protein
LSQASSHTFSVSSSDPTVLEDLLEVSVRDGTDQRWKEDLVDPPLAV